MYKLYKSSLILSLIALMFAFNSCEDNSVEPVLNKSDISGILEDNLGGAVVGAEVTAFAINLNNSTESIISRDSTNESGEFTLREVPENYDRIYVRISHPHFKTYENSLKDYVKDGEGDKKSAKFRMANNDDCCGILEATIINKDGEAINNATVKIWNDNRVQRKASSQENVVKFESLCEGEYKASVYAEGYADATVELEITNCEPLKIEITILSKDDKNNEDCCEGSFVAEVVDSETGVAIDNVVVKLWKDDKVIKDTKSKDGKATFNDLCEGYYVVTFHNNNYKETERDFTLDCDVEVALKLEMVKKESNTDDCKNKVKIIIKDKDGKAVNGTVILVSADGKRFSAQSKDGYVYFENMCVGTYMAGIDANGYESKQFEIAIKENSNETMTIEKKLEKKDGNPNEDKCTSNLKVITKDKDGKAIDAKVTITSKDGKTFTKNTKDGYVYFEELCGGEYTVTIEVDGFDKMEFKVNVKANTTGQSIEKTFGKNDNNEDCKNKVKIITKDKDGKAINGTVIVTSANGKKFTAQSKDGYVYFEDLCIGSYTVVIEAEGYEKMQFEISIRVNSQETMTIEKKLEKKDNNADNCTSNLKVITKGKDGKALDAKVTLTSKDGKSFTKNTKDGYIYFEDLCGGEYTVNIEADGYDKMEFKVNVKVNTTGQSIEKTLGKNDGDDNSKCKSSVKFVLTDNKNNAVDGKITMTSSDGKTKTVNTTRGYGIINGLCADDYTVVIEADGFEKVEMDLTVKTNQDTEVVTVNMKQ